MIARMDKNREYFQCLSVLFPTSNFLSINYELSSCGYENLLDFYKFAGEIKYGFLKEYMNAIYFMKTV